MFFLLLKTFYNFFSKNATNRTYETSISAKRERTNLSPFNLTKKGGEIMKPSSFQRAIRLQFDCLVKRVVDTTVKDYQRELSRRAAHEIAFSELPEQELNRIGTTDEYDSDYSCFEVLGTKVKVNNEQLAEALKLLPEKKLDILLMFYFLEMSDAEIADLLQIDRSTSFRNRKNSLEEIKKILQEDNA